MYTMFFVYIFAGDVVFEELKELGRYKTLAACNERRRATIANHTLIWPGDTQFGLQCVKSARR
jgi:hypothetical protein